MSSLADRLAAASRDRVSTPGPSSRRDGRGRRPQQEGRHQARGHFRRPQGAGAQRPPPAARTQAVRRRAHPDRAGADGARRPPGSDAGRGHPAHHRGAHAYLPGDLRRHLGLRPDRAVPARPGPHRGHGQRPQQHLHRAQRPAGQGGGRVRRRGPPAPDHRQDRLPDRATSRRVEPDGRCPPARRQPRQCSDPSAGGRRLAAHHPQVLRRSVHLRGPGRASGRSRSARRSSCPPASVDASTSWSPAAPARARPLR